MESQYARRLRSGREYDHLFPRPDGKDHEIKRDASVGNTVHFIRDKAPENIWQTKAIARLLKGKSLNDTCRNLWNFVYQHIQYQKDDEGVEQVRSPRRVWWERKGDCDCYTSFISSVLLAMEPPIPHKYRITKYDKEDPSEIRWQHIYPVVPKNGRLDGKLDRRGDYIVLDCVKDAFDTEQSYYEKQDFECKMRLDYLDGIEEEGMEGAEAEYAIPPNVDAMDLAALYDEEELGKAGWLKKAVSKVGGAIKKVGKTIGKGIRFINRIANPATILLRNGFLLAMKENLFRLAGKLRYAYLSDAQAKARGMNMDAFHKLKKVLEKAEKIYHGAGGQNDKLKDAILKGKGNHDHKVPLSGLEGTGNVYADQEEYNIIHTSSIDGLGALGEPVTAATIAAATAALTAIGVALKSVTGLFPKGSKDAKEFDTDGGSPGVGGKAGAAISTASSLISSAKGLFHKGKEVVHQVEVQTGGASNRKGASAMVSTAVKSGQELVHKGKHQADKVKVGTHNFNNPAPPPAPSSAESQQEQTPEALLPAVLPKEDNGTQEMSLTTTADTTKDTTQSTEEKKSLMKDPMGWVKENPIKTALGVLGIAGLAYAGFQAMSGAKKGGGTAGLAGFSPVVRKKRRKGKRGKTAYRKNKIKAIKIL